MLDRASTVNDGRSTPSTSHSERWIPNNHGDLHPPSLAYQTVIHSAPSASLSLVIAASPSLFPKSYRGHLTINPLVETRSWPGTLLAAGLCVQWCAIPLQRADISGYTQSSPYSNLPTCPPHQHSLRDGQEGTSKNQLWYVSPASPYASLPASAVATHAALTPHVAAVAPQPWWHASNIHGACHRFTVPDCLSLTSCALYPVLERADKQVGGHKLGVNGLAIDRDQSIL